MQGLSIYARRFFEELASRLGEGGIIVLDNFQLLGESSELEKLLGVMAEAIAGQATLLILSRSNPPSSLVGLRAKGLLLEINADSVHFNETEWLAAPQGIAMGSDRQRLLQLHKKMGGWISGLVLCQNVDIEQFDNDMEMQLVNEPLFDYFAHEFFHQLDQKSKQLLTHCTYLYHFNSSSAASVSGIASSAKILQTLLDKNHFIQRQGQGFYTLHPLLQAYLQNEVTKTLSTEQHHALMADSARILALQGEHEAAADLYIELHEWDSLAELTVQHVEALFNQGRTATLHKWLAALPHDVKAANNGLLYWQATLKSFTNPAMCLDEMSEVFDRFIEQDDLLGALKSWIFAMQMMNGTWMETQRISEWLHKYQSCKIVPSALPLHMEVQIIACLSMGYFLYGKSPDDTTYWLSQIEETINKCEDQALIAVLANSGMFASLILGHTHQAKKYLAQLNSLTDLNAFPPMLQMHILCNKMMGESFVGDPRVCFDLYQQGEKLANQFGIFLFDGIFHHATIGAAFIAADEEQVIFHHHKFEQIPPFPLINTIGRYWAEAGLRMVQGRHIESEAACSHAIKMLSDELKIPSYGLIIRLTHVETIYAQGRTEEAYRLLDVAANDANELQIPASQIRAHLLKARFAMDAGDVTESNLQLINMFKLAKQHDLHAYPGWLSGELISWACHKALEWGIETDFVIRYVRTLAQWLTPPGPKQLSWPWPVRLYTMGVPRVEFDGTEVMSEGKQSKRPIQLLFQLALHSGEANAIELSEQLYPEQSDEKRSSLLRNNLHRLRTLLGDESTIIREGDVLRINRDLCWIDVHAFEMLALENRQPAIEQALSLYKGEYFSKIRNDSFELLSRREQLRGTYLRLALTQLEHLDNKAAIELCHTVLSVEPLSEVMYQKLMQLYQANKQSDLARATFEQCQRIFQAELGVEPMEETRRIALSDLA
ncbi:MAG: hypothetical protein L3J28_05120 [Candidatus Polarisedimenticolaceae bacterium]|nr:hypothetical protein [Candidatus Polarisedimenticolaceae bacterium]